MPDTPQEKRLRERLRYWRGKAESLQAEQGQRPGQNTEPVSDDPAEQVQALAAWSASSLIVPPGHAAEGQPLTLPAFAEAFLVDALTYPESLLCVARKNAKSAICAVLALGFLAGPLRRTGWRGAVASVNKEKANELRRQCEDIAQASGVEGLRFVRSPQPGHIESDTGRLDILSADRTAGHASGFDLVLVDELGLFRPQARELMAGLRSSTSARAGRIVCISVRGDSELLQEILDRRDAPGTAVHLYESAPDCALDDREAWRAANPGLGTIKQVSYMLQESARVALAPADQSAFRAYDLNAKLRPDRRPILTVEQWQACEVAALPDRSGPCYVGFDAGGSASMTAAACYWPTSGRLEGYGAWPHVPDLLARGRADGVGTAYMQMQSEGALRLFGEGEATDVIAFLTWLVESLRGERVLAIGADRYRQAEIRTALAGASVPWPQVWRGTGASKTADGSHDVRAFQRYALEGRVKALRSILWTMGIGNSDLRFDGAGNPALDKASAKARIDVVQAGVIACGLAALRESKKPRRINLGTV